MLLGLAVGGGQLCQAAEERSAAPATAPTPSIHFRPELPGGDFQPYAPLDLSAGRLDVGLDGARLFRPTSQATASLLGRYRKALERESRRMRDRDPAATRLYEVDEDDSPAPEAQREARKLFKGANNRLLSQVLERILEDSAPLRQARAYAEGVRLDVRRGGGVSVGAGKAGDPSAEIAARFNFVVGTNPRVEMRSTLPGGVRTRVEVALTSPGIRASFSRQISGHLNGTFAGGYEDGGDDRWLSAGVGIRF